MIYYINNILVKYDMTNIRDLLNTLSIIAKNALKSTTEEFLADLKTLFVNVIFFIILIIITVFENVILFAILITIVFGPLYLYFNMMNNGYGLYSLSALLLYIVVYYIDKFLNHLSKQLNSTDKC